MFLVIYRRRVEGGGGGGDDSMKYPLVFPCIRCDISEKGGRGYSRGGGGGGFGDSMKMFYVKIC